MAGEAPEANLCDATSTNIEGYNTFVQDRAAAGHTAIQGDFKAHFRVLGSTADVDAPDSFPVKVFVRP